MRKGDWNGQPVFDDRDMMIFKVQAAIKFMQQIERHLIGDGVDPSTKLKRGRGRPKGSKNANPDNLGYDITRNAIDNALYLKPKAKRGRPTKEMVALRNSLKAKYGWVPVGVTKATTRG